MKAIFSRSANGSSEVGTATWNRGRASIEAEDPDVRSALERIFGNTPVVVDDPAYRPQAARGEVVLQPGDLDWFRAAAFTRAPQEGLTVRLVPEAVAQGGWDPAAAYRPFDDAMRRLLEQPQDAAEPHRGETERAERSPG